MKNSIVQTILTAALILTGSVAFAMSHGDHKGQGNQSVHGKDQDVSGGTVEASKIKSDTNGWLVVHRTDANMKPGPVVGYAPLKAGKNKDVVAILTEPVKKGEMLMLMLHGEAGGMHTGVFEYTLGSKLDGPIKVDGKLVMTVINAQ